MSIRSPMPAQATTWDLLPANEYGILLLYGVGQSEAMWRVRELPAVRRIFAAAWRTTDLVSDFGGCVAFRPAACTDRWRTAERWFHVDMNARTHPTADSLQAFVALTDNTASTGGLVVVPGSQRDHANVTERAAAWWGVDDPDHQFLLLAPNDPALTRGARPKFVACETGDLVLWDSRVAHANTNARVPDASGAPTTPDPAWFDPHDDAAAPAKRRDRVHGRLGLLAGHAAFPLSDACARDPAPALQRLVALVSMAPRARVPPAILERRKGAWVGEQTTSHWPTRFDTDAPVAETNKTDADLSPLRRWLIGYRDADAADGDPRGDL